jgi:glycosyltransferase 2 family protein
VIRLKNTYREIKNTRSFFFLKVAVSTFLVAFILYRGEWARTWKDLCTADPFAIILVFFCMIGSVIISAMKWRVLLSIHGAHVPLGLLSRYYFIAVFLNNFLPSSIGGDGFRIYKTATEVDSKIHAVFAVLVERASGLWALVFLGFLGGLSAGPQLTGLPYFLPTLWAIGAVLAASFLVVAGLFVACDRYLTRTDFPAWLTSLLGLINDYRRHPDKTLQVVLISFIFQLYILLWMLLLAKAVGGNITIFQLAVALMISNLAAIIPISLNGIGLMDGSFIYIASLMGMGYDDGVAMMLINRIFLIFLSLIGAFFYLRLKTKPEAC